MLGERLSLGALLSRRLGFCLWLATNLVPVGLENVHSARARAEPSVRVSDSRACCVDSQVVLGLPSAVLWVLVAHPLDLIKAEFAVIEGVLQDLLDNVLIGIVVVVIIIIVFGVLVDWFGPWLDG